MSYARESTETTLKSILLHSNLYINNSTLTQNFPRPKLNWNYTNSPGIYIPTEMRPSLALLLATMVACLLVPKAEAGLFLGKVGQTAKDVGEKVHEGARKIETGIKNIFSPDCKENAKSSTTAVPDVQPVPADVTLSPTTPDPRNIISGAKRCLPTEVLAADGDCRTLE